MAKQLIWFNPTKKVFYSTWTDYDLSSDYKPGYKTSFDHVIVQTIKFDFYRNYCSLYTYKKSFRNVLINRTIDFLDKLKK